MQLPGKPGTTDCWSAANDNCSLYNDTTPKICAERKGVGCSQCHYGCVNNSQAEIDGMKAYDESLRMLVIAESGSHFPATPRPQAENVNTGWLKPSAMGGGFSAVCYFFGRDLSKTLQPARPIGLVQAAVGGTSLQYWSSDAAIAKCQSLGKPWQWPRDFRTGTGKTAPNATPANYSLPDVPTGWNAKLVPLVSTAARLLSMLST